MQLSIVSPAPHYPGNSRVIAGTYPGIYRILCPRRPRDLPQAYAGTYPLKRAGNLPWDVHIYLTKGARSYGAGTYTQGFTRKMSPAVPGSTRGCTLDITKYKIESRPGQVTAIPG